MPDANVVFRHAGAPRFSTGRTDADGRFQLTTFTTNDGAVIGENVITVIKSESPSGAPVGGAHRAAIDNAAIDAAFEKAMSQAPAASPIPAKYSHQNTSDLHREVVAGDNFFEIELAD